MHGDGNQDSSDLSGQATSTVDNERLVGLETKIAFQERTIQQLNDQMYQQQRQIDQLNRVVVDLSSKLTSALSDVEVDDSSAGNTDVDADVPPHY